MAALAGEIRLGRAGDGAACAAIYAPSVTGTATSFEVVPPDGAEMARRIDAVLTHAPWLVLEDGSAIAGYAYATRHRERAGYAWSCDVSVYVGERYHRRGVGRALYTRLFELLRRQGWYVAHAGIALPNPASVALHESFGFTPVGVYPAVGYKLGAWHDVGWWRLVLRAPDGAPQPLRPVTEVAAE